ncbi:hypothetical protein V1502_10110 [Bacillus sp. SCS-153A]|uniref:hypothetical protein n=1 Tax=Rossellomorea sedimentorum TaxID=3115294 RepID=UPI00390621AF
MKFKILLLSAAAVSLITGCQAVADNHIKIDLKTLQKQQELLETYTYEDYQHLYEQVFAEADEIKVAHEKIRKWVIRELTNEALFYETDLTQEQVLHLAQQSMKEDETWKKIAMEEYGVTVTEEEVDTFIQEGPDTSTLPQHHAFAEAMGMSLEDLNHTYDRDLYEKHAMWDKLKEVLEKEYGTSDNNELVQRYNEEVENRLDS